MRSLNLSGTEKKTDGRLKSLFWPTVENAWDVDYLCQPGFWLCLFIAVLSFCLDTIMASEVPNPASLTLILIMSAVVSFVHFVGDVGVRQASWPAVCEIINPRMSTFVGAQDPHLS